MRDLVQVFILTRFNLNLWKKDKKGEAVRTMSWLEHRFMLFEQYCIPSIQNQSCKEFQWIILFDSTTPERFKGRIDDYKSICPQLVPVYVEPENGSFFPEIFKQEVIKRLPPAYNNEKKRVLTTYLDNDDALNVGFVEDI